MPVARSPAARSATDEEALRRPHELGLTPKRARPYRPRTNGKIERSHRTLADGWAYARLYESTQQRNAALPAWMHFYNHRRPAPPSEAHHQSPD
ncbi:hypothetical protein GCM10009854_40610 [Saccharopolyspora halophila]|uniref:Integrase catalytic domain-containing protein n=1 Tax=Saccharopolyspora halophila TaxID=405551 RepID=A0ABN3GR05_9PSEU